MTIIDFLENNAKNFGDDVCLVEVNPDLPDNIDGNTWKEYSLIETTPNEQFRRELTWKEFNDISNTFADGLVARGIKKGDKVAILLMNCLEWLPIYFGILKTGALVVPLNYRYTADEIKYCLDLSNSDAIIFGKEFIGRMESICDIIPDVKMKIFVGQDCPTFSKSYSKMLSRSNPIKPDVELNENDDAALYFSSGTTGFPKAILHNHLSLVSSCETEQNHHSQTKDDVFLCIPPLYHTGAKMHWFGSLLVGGKAVLLRGIKPEWILKAISDENCSIVWLLVPWAQDLLDAVDRGDINLEDYNLEQWRLMHIGAQPVPPSLIKRWKKMFPNHKYDTNYGLSESIGPGCVHLGVDNIHKVGAIGIPGYKWEVKICDGARNEVEKGSVGELAVKGRGVMTCYYNDPKSTEAVLSDGWLFTGDMAKMDEDGFIYLVDRKKDVIITGGENLYPVQIEDFLRSHSAIKDVAVIGLPDERLGEVAAAIIEIKAGYSCEEEEIVQFCYALPRYKRPRKIIFDEVPRNPTGKIEKTKLREKYCGGSLVAAQIK